MPVIEDDGNVEESDGQLPLIENFEHERVDLDPSQATEAASQSAEMTESDSSFQADRKDPRRFKRHPILIPGVAAGRAVVRHIVRHATRKAAKEAARHAGKGKFSCELSICVSA